MELINGTRMPAAYTMGREPSGRDLLVVAVKGTFRIPAHGEHGRLADEQVPLITADAFTGAPGMSAPVYEMDFAPRKRRCDVLLLGNAHAPHGRPALRVPVDVRVGDMHKTFAVVGDRAWRAGIAGISASDPKPFTSMPVTYDRAFGGADDRDDDRSRHTAFTRNPVGRGFHKQMRSEWVDGTALPNTEELDRPVTWPDRDYVPMAFGPIGRGWEPRRRYAGTYDQHWLDEHFPFLPPDFDEAYYQAAPLDQQIAHPGGGEPVTLVNLTVDGHVGFTLPTFDAPVHFFPKRGGREDGKLVLDTIVIEPDEGRFTLTWRATRPLKRDMFEVAQIIVGRKAPAWWSAREEASLLLPVILAAAGPTGGGPAA